MRRMHRIVLLAGLVALAPVLAGCENFDMDKLDVFGLNEKKKLPGDRKPVFPEGVPGVTQGIPPEFVKGNQPPPDTAQTPPTEQDNQANAGRAGQEDRRGRAGGRAQAETEAQAEAAPTRAAAAQPQQPASAATGASASSRRRASNSRRRAEHRQRALAVGAGSRHLLALI